MMSPTPQPSHGRSSLGYWCLCIAALFLGGCGIPLPRGVSFLADEFFLPKWVFAIYFVVFVHVAIWIVQLACAVISLRRAGDRKTLTAACVACIFGQLMGAVLCLTILADPAYESIFKCASCPGPDYVEQLRQLDIQCQATVVVVTTAIVVVGLTAIVISLGVSETTAPIERESVAADATHENRAPQASSNPYAPPET